MLTEDKHDIISCSGMIDACITPDKSRG